MGPRHARAGLTARRPAIGRAGEQGRGPEAGPFVDDRAAKAAERLDLPSDAGKLLKDVARGGGYETLSWLVGALALVDARDEYGTVRPSG